jgi:ATP-binding cassette, subfamily C, bacterial
LTNGTPDAVKAQGLRSLVPPELRGQLLRLLGLMLASAVLEGFGLILLVPMFALLDGSADGGAMAGVADWLDRHGIGLSPGPLLALFVALVLLRALVNHQRTLKAHQYCAAVVDGLRARAWQALLQCDWRTLSDMRQSDSASLLITSVDRIGSGLNSAAMAMAALITLAGLGLAALAIAPAMALAAMLGGIVVLAGFRGARSRAAAHGERLNDAYGRVFADTTEVLAALRPIKSFAREDVSAHRVAQGFAGLREAELAYYRDIGIGQIVLQGGGAVVMAVLVWLAMTRWHADAAQVVPLVALFARALPLLSALQHSWQGWAHAAPALYAAEGLIARADAHREPPVNPGIAAPAAAENIRLDQVTIRYASRDRPALDAVSIRIAARRITALVGPSGAGKSTLADVLGGLIAPDAGSVLIDGTQLDGASRRAWRSRVAYVQQEPMLFSGTVRENLNWAEPLADEAHLRDALEMASAGFVFDLPDGLDARVGEGGRQLSGGERQRIVLARALLRDPALLILDEATSALDAANDEAIAGALLRLRERMTIVVIGHRGELTRIADSTIRLDAGKVIATD